MKPSIIDIRALARAWAAGDAGSLHQLLLDDGWKHAPSRKRVVDMLLALKREHQKERNNT